MGFKARPLGGIVSSKLIVAGVLALDDLKTPKRSEKKIVGGAGVYSSISSSFFTKTALIAAIGNDFPNQIVDKLGSNKNKRPTCCTYYVRYGYSCALFKSTKSSWHYSNN